jgi:hypothetical protein
MLTSCMAMFLTIYGLVPTEMFTVCSKDITSTAITDFLFYVFTYV